MPATNFADIGRTAKDVLVGGREGVFQFNNVATVSTRTADGVDFAIKGVHRDGALATDLKGTYDTSRYKFVATLAQATGKLGLAASVKNVAPGVTLGLSGTIPDVESGKLAVEYLGPHINLKSATSLSAAPKVDVAATSAFLVKGRSVVAGADVSYDAAKGAISKWAVGMGYTAADYQVATLYNEKQELSVLIAHSVRPDLTVGAEVVKNMGEAGATSLTAAVQRRLATGALQKVKVQHSGIVSVMHEQTLEGKSKVAISGQFDSKDLNNAPKYGVAFDLKY